MIATTILTAKLIERRDDMRRLLGDGYEDQVGIARQVIRGIHRETGKPLAEVALAVAKKMEAAGHDPSLVFAALVDESEASR